jgi:hypothetical protein
LLLKLMLLKLEGSLGRSLIGRSTKLPISSYSHGIGQEKKGMGRDIPGPKDIENTREKIKILAIPAIPVDVFE